MISASVSNVDLYRSWSKNEDLGIEWLIQRLTTFEQTPQMKAGEAFHKGLEVAPLGEIETMWVPPYTFEFACNCEISIQKLRELRVQGVYGQLQVRGRVDAISGQTVTDYKTTGQFDAERYIEGYQWRYYLDLMGAHVFRWEVFVIKETDDPLIWQVTDFHRLEQKRYPELHADCARLANDYAEFAAEHLVLTAQAH